MRYPSEWRPGSEGARNALLGHCGAVLWLTGFSGAGKSTLARGLEKQMLEKRVLAAVVDGDVLRTGLSNNLGFTPEDRSENVRRATEVALYLAEAGAVAIVALIAPLRVDREKAASRVRERGVAYAEVFINAPFDVCEKRDPKGLYKRARAGEIPAFTGVGAPYQCPLHPDLEIATGRDTPDQSLAKLVAFALKFARVPARARSQSRW